MQKTRPALICKHNNHFFRKVSIIVRGVQTVAKGQRSLCCKFNFENRTRQPCCLCFCRLHPRRFIIAAGSGSRKARRTSGALHFLRSLTVKTSVPSPARLEISLGSKGWCPSTQQTGRYVRAHPHRTDAAPSLSFEIPLSPSPSCRTFVAAERLPFAVEEQALGGWEGSHRLEEKKSA